LSQAELAVHEEFLDTAIHAIGPFRDENWGALTR
jgi:hypothetical protein